MIILIFKIAFLFIAILFTYANVIRAWLQSEVPSVNMLVVAIGWTGFITLQWLI